MSSKMRIEFSEANNAWVLMFGDEIIDVHHKRFFEDKKELLWELGFKTMKEFECTQKGSGWKNHEY